MNYPIYSFSKIMTHWHKIGGLALALLIAGTMPAFAQSSTSTWKRPQYKPPAGLSAPGNLSQGGTRSGSGDVSVQRLLPLVPQELNFGVTTEAYPSFFVYVSNLQATPDVKTLEFSLMDDQGAEVYKASYAVDLEHNILRIDLPPQAGLAPLEIDKDYIWMVQGFTEDLSLSDTLFAHGWVRRVMPSESLVNSLAAAKTTSERANAYVDEGIWYDAIATLETNLNHTTVTPNDRAQLNALLESAGIVGVDVKHMQ